MRKTIIAIACCLGSSFFSMAWAHNPVCACNAVTDTEIECTGGFSDGSTAPGVTLDVIGYDEETLIAGQLDAASRLRFSRPEQKFYILFDAGPGHVVEIDHAEIERQ